MTDLSVITIVRNRPRHLARLIEGLANSSTPPSELIVVDMSDEPVCVPRLAFPHYRIEVRKNHRLLVRVWRRLLERHGTPWGRPVD